MMVPTWMLLVGVPCIITRSPVSRAGLMLPDATVTKGVVVDRIIWSPKYMATTDRMGMAIVRMFMMSFRRLRLNLTEMTAYSSLLGHIFFGGLEVP